MRRRYHEAGVLLKADLVDELARLYPEGRVDKYRFRFDLYEDDPRLEPILDWFNKQGMEVWRGGPQPKVDGYHYQVRVWREYDEADYADVRYVRMIPTAKGNGLFRDQQGRVKMIDGDFPRRADIIVAPLRWIIAPSRVKEALERESFRGVVFRETVLVGGAALTSRMKPKPWSSHGEPWWELTSDIVLPPLSPTMDLRDDDGNPVRNADCSRGCIPGRTCTFTPNTATAPATWRPSNPSTSPARQNCSAARATSTPGTTSPRPASASSSSVTNGSATGSRYASTRERGRDGSPRVTAVRHRDAPHRDARVDARADPWHHGQGAGRDAGLADGRPPAPRPGEHPRDAAGVPPHTQRRDGQAPARPQSTPNRRRTSPDVSHVPASSTRWAGPRLLGGDTGLAGQERRVMRTRCLIGGLELASNLIDELAEIYPEGRTDAWRFECELYDDDPRTQAILKWLERQGMRAWDGFVPRQDGVHYNLGLRREYAPSDYAGIRYVRLAPVAKGNGLFRDECGRVKMIDGDFPRRADIIAAPLRWIIAPSRVKEALEREGFRGVVFRETVLVGGASLVSRMKPKPWSSHGEPWWELTSDITLPPLSPTMDLRDEKGEPVRDADCSRGCYPREGSYVEPEFRYRAEGLATVEPFDLARTAERFGRAGHVDTWNYIASARVREFFVGHKWKCDWIPVRLDPWRGTEGDTT